jgi:hypothetical protein
VPDPDGLVTAMPTTIRNESALGIYVFAWTSATGTRCELCWYEGLDAPCFSFWIGPQGRMCPPIVVRDPERFGWKPPRKVADFKAFAQRFADACEAEQ